MYQEIENILVRTLSPFEYERLEDLKQTYTEEQIVEAYKRASVKNVNYIAKVLSSIKKTPTWLNKDIVNQEIDTTTKKEFEDFNSFIESFRNDNK
jgi:hypothetical protein